jgi:hypothetical protein
LSTIPRRFASDLTIPATFAVQTVMSQRFFSERVMKRILAAVVDRP